VTKRKTIVLAYTANSADFIAALKPALWDQLESGGRSPPNLKAGAWGSQPPNTSKRQYIYN